MYVTQDRLLFLGDALYESTGGEAGGAARTLTAENAFRLLNAVIAFDAELYVEGHTDTVMPRAEAIELLDEIRWAGELVSESVADARSLDEEAARATAREDLGAEPSELQADLIRAFIAGRRSDVRNARSWRDGSVRSSETWPLAHTRLAASGPREDRFDVVPVRVNDERCVIPGVVMRAKTRRAVVAAAGFDSGAVELSTVARSAAAKAT